MQCCQTRIYLDRSCWFMAWVSYSTVYWAYSPLQKFIFVKRNLGIVLNVRQFYSICHSVIIKYTCSNPLQVLHNVQPYIQFYYYNTLKFPNLTVFFLTPGFRITTRSPSKIWRWFTKSAQFLICKVNYSSLFKLDVSFTMRSVCWKISRHCPCTIGMRPKHEKLWKYNKCSLSPEVRAYFIIIKGLGPLYVYVCLAMHVNSGGLLSLAALLLLLCRRNSGRMRQSL